MATALHNLSEYDLSKIPDASNMCIGIVVSEWNAEVTGALLNGAVQTLEKHGALPENIHVKTVPGSFELVYGAHQMVLNGGYDAVIILGCVIKGETSITSAKALHTALPSLMPRAKFPWCMACLPPTTSNKHSTAVVENTATRATNVPLWPLRWPSFKPLANTATQTTH